MQRAKLSKHFSPRADQLCNSALCNGIVGTLDIEIASKDIDVIVCKDLCVDGMIKSDGTFHLSYGVFQDKKVVVKQICNDSKLNSNAQLVLANELLILTHLGNHANIILP